MRLSDKTKPAHENEPRARNKSVRVNTLSEHYSIEIEYSQNKNFIFIIPQTRTNLFDRECLILRN